jgi:hypothetical protein
MTTDPADPRWGWGVVGWGKRSEGRSVKVVDVGKRPRRETHPLLIGIQLHFLNIGRIGSTFQINLVKSS